MVVKNSRPIKLELALQVFDILEQRLEIEVAECYKYLQTTEARKVRVRPRHWIFPRNALSRRSKCSDLNRARAIAYTHQLTRYVDSKKRFQELAWFRKSVQHLSQRNPLPQAKDLLTSYEHEVVQKRLPYFKNLKPTDINITRRGYVGRRLYFPKEHLHPSIAHYLCFYEDEVEFLQGVFI